jgi:hypothetical protein
MTTSDETSANDLLRALRAMFEAFGGADVWSVKRIRMDSPPVIDASTSDANAAALAAKFPAKAELAAAGKPVKKLTAVEAMCLREMLRLTNAGIIGGVVVQSAVGQKKVVLNHRSMVRLAEVSPTAIAPTVVPRAEVGELRGRLEQITARKGDDARFSITDRLTGVVVKCAIPANNQQLLKKAGGAIGSLVVVTGEIRYGPNAQPTSIVAADIAEIETYIIPYSKWKPLDITGGVDSVKYVRRLRDG